MQTLPNQSSPKSIMSFQAALRLLTALVFLLVPVAVLAATTSKGSLPKLAAPPLGERWYKIVVDGERVGFAHLTIAQAADGYRIDSDSSAKMSIMGFSREAATKESYLVGPDLSIKSFQAQTVVDKKPMALTGEVVPAGIRVTTETGGGKKEHTIKVKGPVFPPQALNLYPLMQGTPPGKSNKIPTFDVESVKVKQIKVEVIGAGTLPPGTAVMHLRNNLYPMVDNDIWVDLKGDTLRESVRDDLVLTEAESEPVAKAALAEMALSKSDLALDFSLVKLTPPLERPAGLKKLTVDFTGFPAGFPLLQGKAQQSTRLADGTVRFTMPNPAFEAPAAGQKVEEKAEQKAEQKTEEKTEQKAAEKAEQKPPAGLEASQSIPSQDKEIVAQKDEILGAEQDPAKAAKLLAEWVAKEIKVTVTDDRPPVETLKSRAGNSRAHSRLYLALARTAGIPSRFVAGLAYYAGQGFLYHSWAESYLNGAWIPVDPTLGEFPADLTHIKLVEGDTPEDLGVLAGVIGKIRATVAEQVNQ